MGDSEQTIIVKSNQEGSIKVVIDELTKQREEGRTVNEESPVGSSASNGVVERAVQGVDGADQGDPARAGRKDAEADQARRGDRELHSRVCGVPLGQA